MLCAGTGAHTAVACAGTHSSFSHLTHACAVALLKFTRPFFEVSESEGLDGVCVRLELPRGGAVSQPVTFRTLVRQLGDKRTYINMTVTV